MTDRAPERLAVGSALLVVGAAIVLVAGSQRSIASETRSREFQALLSGLGSGSATSLAECARAFNSGISDTCARDLDPVPGGTSFCPHHAGPTLRR